MVKKDVRHYLNVRNATSAKQHIQEIEQRLIDLIKEGIDVDFYARMFDKLQLINTTCEEVLKLLKGQEVYNQFQKDTKGFCENGLIDNNI